MSNESTINEIFILLRRRLERSVSRIVPPREIEDIVQETYVRVCQAGQVEAIRHPRSFLYRIARNLALDHMKRAESHTLSLDDDSAEEDIGIELQADDDTCDHAAARQEFELFCEAVRQLPVQCRRAFILRKVYGYSQKEIAQDLNISENTVEKHIAHGLKRCNQFVMTRMDVMERQEPASSIYPHPPMRRGQ
jgi:RNA polymerase sigma factor (sigma-70 family)